MRPAGETTLQSQLIHREFCGCSCQGLEQHHQDTKPRKAAATPAWSPPADKADMAARARAASAIVKGLAILDRVGDPAGMLILWTSRLEAAATS
jgi:hypothetical protein